MTYSIGQRFELDGDQYLLAVTDYKKVAFIDLITGARLKESVVINDYYNISEAEMLDVTNYRKVNPIEENKETSDRIPFDRELWKQGRKVYYETTTKGKFYELEQLQVFDTREGEWFVGVRVDDKMRFGFKRGELCHLPEEWTVEIGERGHIYANWCTNKDPRPAAGTYKLVKI